MPYKIHSVQIYVDDGSDVKVPDIISQGMDNSPQIDAIIGAAKVQPEHVALIAQRITGNFDTFAIPTVLDETGLKALCIATETQFGVKFFLADFSDCGTVEAGSVHRHLLVSAGVVVPRRITVDHQGHARLSVDVVVVKESANNAIVISDTEALPTIPDAGNRWSLGPVQVGDVTLSDYTSLEIDFGNTVETRGTQSYIWDQYVEVRTHAPTITVTGIDPQWFKESGGVPISGLACTHANTIMYLRKRAGDGTGWVADGTEEHIKFTAAGVATVQQPMQGDAHRFSDTSVQITCYEDGDDNDPIIVDTTSAIT